MSKADRQAIAWLWQHYLRRYILAIAGVTVLVLIYGLALVWILSLLNANFTNLFSQNAGEYTFADVTAQAHTTGEFLDANGDGIYEFDIEITLPNIPEPRVYSLALGLTPEPDQRPTSTFLAASAYSDAEGILKLRPDELLARLGVLLVNIL